MKFARNRKNGFAWPHSYSNSDAFVSSPSTFHWNDKHDFIDIPRIWCDENTEMDDNLRCSLTHMPQHTFAALNK